MSCLGRERVFAYAARHYNTPVSLIRLNYAVDLRYGVLVDIAQRVNDGAPIDLSMGFFNCIWQGDANAMALAALADAASPPAVYNVTGVEQLVVREVALEFGRLLGREPRFVNVEQPDALLSNTAAMQQRFGQPSVSGATLVQWVADWITRGGSSLGKLTQYDQRTGAF